MPETSLLKKLRLAPKASILLLNASPDWESFFRASQEVSTKPAGKTDLILLFAPDKRSLETLIAQVKPVLSEEGIIWVAFPKGSSKIQTDLTRDKGWESMPETEWQFLNLISLDNTWSAFSFRKTDGKIGKGRRALRTMTAETNTPENEYIDPVNRVITLPEDLAAAFEKNPEAIPFFESLSFTNRKEYVVWVTSAKRPETREFRVLETINKLKQQLKNPRDKG